MYQQKWSAKKETRAYHGDHLTEKEFRSLWDRRVVGVASDNPKDSRKIPLASQNYASLERRLDIAVFRALFASSTRQAKQIIVHGKVKVNGTQIKQPGYLLRPGDLFEVDPAAVMMNVSNPLTANAAKLEAAIDTDKEQSTSEQDTAIPHSTSRRCEWERLGHSHFVPKPFMSAFAFIPQYLEVSFTTCSAIYLRDPVARPGSTEVPSPYGSSVHSLAANFYQRGR